MTADILTFWHGSGLPQLLTLKQICCMDFSHGCGYSELLAWRWISWVSSIDSSCRCICTVYMPAKKTKADTQKETRCEHILSIFSKMLLSWKRNIISNYTNYFRLLFYHCCMVLCITPEIAPSLNTTWKCTLPEWPLKLHPWVAPENARGYAAGGFGQWKRERDIERQ